MSNYIGAPRISEGDTNKEGAINDAFGDYDAAMCELVPVDMSPTGDVTMSLATLQSGISFQLNAAGLPKNLILPAAKRLARFDNQSSVTITLAVGTATSPLLSGANALFYLDGTTNGLAEVGGSGGGGSVPAGGLMGQGLRKTSGASGDATWYDPDTAAVPYDAPHRAWRVFVLHSDPTDPDHYCSINKLSFLDVNGSAIPMLSGTILDGSSQTPGAAGAFDNDDSTRWVANYPVSSNPTQAWLGYDWGASSPVSVLTIAIKSPDDPGQYMEAPTDFKLQWSDDLSTWNDVQEFTHSGWTQNQLVNFPVTADYMKPHAYSFVPNGGATGQVLTKNSGTDGDTGWATPSGGGGGGGGGIAPVYYIARDRDGSNNFTIVAQQGVSSFVRVNTGIYQITFSSPQPLTRIPVCSATFDPFANDDDLKVSFGRNSSNSPPDDYTWVNAITLHFRHENENLFDPLNFRFAMIDITV